MPTRHVSLGHVGERIRALREAAGYSQDNFALEAGIARSYYSGIERGERNVAVLNLIRIASTLGVEVGELFPSIAELRRNKLPVVSRRPGRPRKTA